MAAFLVGLSVGPYDIGPLEVLRISAARAAWFPLDSGDTNAAQVVVLTLRWPRVLLAMLVGVALSCSGAALQGCFRNPLVEPYILGVSSGAAFGAALAIVFPHLLPSVAAAAFGFGLLAVSATSALSRVRGTTAVVTLVLIGVAVGSFFSALVSGLKYLADEAALREIVFWLMGGFYYATWEDVRVVAPTVVLCFLLMWRQSWRLNLLSLGDDEARSLGVHPPRVRRLMLVAATLATAVSVAASGTIAWVGLMVPHAARMLLGADNRFVIPASAALGGSYLILCDALARSLTTHEIPLGIITSVLGAPYLFYLLRGKLGGLAG